MCIILTDILAGWLEVASAALRIKCQPCRPTGWEEPRECTRRSQQLGIHTFVVAYRNTTHYNIQAVTWRMFGKMGHPGLQAISRATCLTPSVQLASASQSKSSGMSEDVSVLWLLMRVGIEPLGKKACVSAAAQLVP
jgi:hypothetical protein